MTKHELMELMRLLAALETALIYSGGPLKNLPDSLREQIADSVEVLEREILK